MNSLANRLLFLYLCMRFAETLWTFKFSKKMKITIINTEKSEKRYAREELDAFVSQLKDGTYCQQYIRDFKKDVCFAAEWVKTNGELKAKSFNPLVLLSLENLRDLATANEYKRFAIQQPYTLLCFLGHDGHSLHTRCQAHTREGYHETTGTEVPDLYHPKGYRHGTRPQAFCNGLYIPQTDSRSCLQNHRDMIYDSKTNCFGIEGSISSPRRDSLLQTKTNCFGVMMVYDAFAKRVI